MKRKKNKLKFYRKRVDINSIAFDFTSEIYYSDIRVNILSGNHYKFKFRNAIGPNTYLTVTHIPSQRIDVCINLTAESSKQVLNDKYTVYETHSISLDGKVLYIALENINLSGHKDQENVHIYRPLFDLGIGFFDKSNYKRLLYIAPDEIAGINASQISQNNSLFTKKAGAITSSSVQKYLGWFVDKPYDKHGNKTSWKLNTKTIFNGWLGSRVRFGSMKEDDMILAYLNQYPNRVFKQTGYTVHPGRPNEWGASPDGLILVDGDLRTIEFKTSMFGDCTFKGYYIAQVLWEMECLSTKKGELVKYSTKKKNSNALAEIKCRLAILEQDSELQTEIKKLVTASKIAEIKGNSHEFKKLVHTKNYVDMRLKLEDMAKTLKYVEIIIPTKKMEEMECYRKSIYQVEIPEEMTGHPLMKDIEERQMKIYKALNDKDNYNFERLVIRQIRDYTLLI